MQCLQPAAEDKPKSAWRCSFCLDRHETVNISIEEEPCVERRGRKKSSLNIQRYVYLMELMLYFIQVNKRGVNHLFIL